MQCSGARGVTSRRGEGRGQAHRLVSTMPRLFKVASMPPAAVGGQGGGRQTARWPAPTTPTPPLSTSPPNSRPPHPHTHSLAPPHLCSLLFSQLSLQCSRNTSSTWVSPSSSSTCSRLSPNHCSRERRSRGRAGAGVKPLQMGPPAAACALAAEAMRALHAASCHTPGHGLLMPPVEELPAPPRQYRPAPNTWPGADYAPTSPLPHTPAMIDARIT